MLTKRLKRERATPPPATFRPRTGRAPAKINLTLAVLGKRPDGYHELQSMVIGVGLYDAVTLAPRAAGAPAVRCDVPELAREDNLAWRAVERLAGREGFDPSALSLRLDKRIPVGSGMGGGSSDAAAVLRLLNAVGRMGYDRRELAGIGAALGSDVPVFFHLPAARMSGRGERVEPVSMRWSGWVMLVHTGIEVSTRAVYAAWDEHPVTTPRQVAEEREAFIGSAASAEAWMPKTFNDLEPIVFRVAPEAARMHRELEKEGLGPLRVSGAGGTLYRAFDAEESARETARRVAACKTDVRVTVVPAPVEADAGKDEEC